MINNNNYKGYSLFNDVEDPALKSWNRAAILFNLHEENRTDLVAGYFNCLSDREKLGSYLVLMKIKEKGYDATKRELIREGT